MAEQRISVPFDMRTVKKKIIGNLTKRQLICFSLAAAFAIPTYIFSKKIVSSDIASLLLVAVAAPFLIAAAYEKNQMRIEKILYFFIRWQYIFPQVRANKKDSKKASDSAVKNFNEKVKTKVFNKGKKIPETPIETLSIGKIYKDGLCELEDNMYSKTIEFFDITYQLSSDSVKVDILEKYSDLLNSFPDDVNVQISFINQQLNINDYEDSISIPRIAGTSDEFDYIREEYSEILRTQFEKGNNSIIKRKFITITTSAKTIKEARQKLDQVELQTISNFNRLEAKAYSLTGVERIKLLRSTARNTCETPIYVDWKKESSNVDLIAPDKLTFKKDYFKVDKSFGVCSYFQILSSHLTDRILMDFLDIDTTVSLNIHIQPLDQNKALKMVKRLVTDIDAMRVEAQKNANRNFYSEDLIPQPLINASEGSKKILNSLQKSDEKLFMVTIIMTNYANSKSDLEINFKKSSALAERSTNKLVRLEYLQENGYISTIPIGLNRLKHLERALTTYSLAILEPFTTQELFQQTGRSLYYGLNALSHNMIMCDRLKLTNPNGLILGKPGTGKSFSAKREIVNVYFTSNNPIYICDPEGEYSPLVKALGGQVITISPTSSDYINPLDISRDYDDSNPIALKSSFMLSFFELIMNPHKITPIDRGIIDEAVKKVCEYYLIDPKHKSMPTLTDIYNLLSDRDEQQADFLCESMKYYVTGSNNFFNHRTNVNLNNRVVCFDIKEMSDQLKPLAMLIIQDFVWSKVAANRKLKINTWFYIDEFHLLLNEKETAEYSVSIWKRFRKWGGVPTGITQNIKDFLQSSKVENIFENSDFVYMLGQGPHDRELLAEKLHISDSQLNYLAVNEPGKGLIYYGGIIIPFEDVFPKDTQLYKLITTRLQEAQ